MPNDFLIYVFKYSVFIREINIPLAHDLSLRNIQLLKNEEEKIKNIFIKNARSLLTFNCIRFCLKRPWCWERLKVGEEWDDRGWDGWMASPTQRTWVWVNCGSWWWTGLPGVLHAVHGVANSQTQLSDWTELKCYRSSENREVKKLVIVGFPVETCLGEVYKERHDLDRYNLMDDLLKTLSQQGCLGHAEDYFK